MDLDKCLTLSEKQFLKNEATKGLYEAPNFHLEYISNMFKKLNKKYGSKLISKIYGLYLFNSIKILS